MMTNEQLATLSKSGHSEFLSPLWENNTQTHRTDDLERIFEVARGRG